MSEQLWADCACDIFRTLVVAGLIFPEGVTLRDAMEDSLHQSPTCLLHLLLFIRLNFFPAIVREGVARKLDPIDMRFWNLEQLAEFNKGVWKRVAVSMQ